MAKTIKTKATEFKKRVKLSGVIWNDDTPNLKKMADEADIPLAHAVSIPAYALEKIAEERGLSTGTVAGHLIRLRTDHPKEDLDFYRPDEKLIEKVAQAAKKQKEGPPSQKYIFEALGRKVSYDDIKLAVAFL